MKLCSIVGRNCSESKSAYARGFTSSRQIERLCKENVVFMALSGDSQPHFTTIADFISRMGDVIQDVFTQVLMVCDSRGLIGREMFAIDGCKLPSNAAKEWSGTFKEMEKKHKKIDRAVRRMLAKHREEDTGPQENDDTRRAAEERNIASLREASSKIKKYLTTSEERRGLSGKVVKSNITDNESASMFTSHGSLQGYNGVAAVDDKHQIVVAAEAYGQGPENNLAPVMIEQVLKNLGKEETEDSHYTLDAGFHSKATVEYCEQEQINALIADGNFRKRDPRFTDHKRYQPKARRARWFNPTVFAYDSQEQTCTCPAGNVMCRGHEHTHNDNRYVTFIGYVQDCRGCPLQKQCMRYEVSDRSRQVSIRKDQVPLVKSSALEKMKAKVDSVEGRYRYSRRLGTVEPVFGNTRTTKRLNRFSLRGKTKANAQWMMYCLVHNIEKLKNYGQFA